MNAILGWSEACIAVHPSDMCVALAALEATVHVSGPKGDRAIPFAEFHRLPGDTPDRDTNLAADEIITAIELPAEEHARNYSYLKIRDRLSYAFALVSVAAGLKLEGGASRRLASHWALSPTSPGACPTPKSASRASSQAEKRSAKRPTSSCREPKALPITTSRSNLRAARSCEPSNRQRRERRNLSP